MPIKLRIATFNLESLDDKPGQKPTLNEHIALMRPQLLRLNADILCLQEVNGQEEPGHPRRLLALERLLADTAYAGYHQVSTMTDDGTQVYDERKLVILSHFEILEHHQYKHDFAPAPRYQKVTAKPEESEAKEVTSERPILEAGRPGSGDADTHRQAVRCK
jgi:endonuclease/exonuclease/phosphatase family metal-dependent hydrolase